MIRSRADGRQPDAAQELKIEIVVNDRPGGPVLDEHVIQPELVLAKHISRLLEDEGKAQTQRQRYRQPGKKRRG